MVLFYAQDFKVDQSALSGEADTIPRYPQEKGSQKDMFDSPQIVFSGTIVISGTICCDGVGEAYAIVARTGDKTVIGQINHAAKLEHRKRSPLSIEITNFCRIISIVALSTAFLLLFVAFGRTGRISSALVFSIGILISWIPQGLPLVVTM